MSKRLNSAVLSPATVLGSSLRCPRVQLIPSSVHDMNQLICSCVTWNIICYYTALEHAALASSSHHINQRLTLHCINIYIYIEIYIGYMVRYCRHSLHLLGDCRPSVYRPSVSTLSSTALVSTALVSCSLIKNLFGRFCIPVSLVQPSITDFLIIRMTRPQDIAWKF